MQYNKKRDKFKSVAPKRKGETLSQIRRSPSQNMSESKYSFIFQEPMNRGKYASLSLWVKSTLGKSSCVSKISPLAPKKQRITVAVFVSNLQLTALLLKCFCLRLHCYTLRIGFGRGEIVDLRSLPFNSWKSEITVSKSKIEFPALASI